MEQITEGLMGAEKGVNLHLTLALAIEWPLEKNPNKSKHQQKIIPIRVPIHSFLSQTNWHRSRYRERQKRDSYARVWRCIHRLIFYFVVVCVTCSMIIYVCPDAELHHNVCYCELEFDKETNAILIWEHKSMCLEHLQMVTGLDTSPSHTFTG